MRRGFFKNGTPKPDPADNDGMASAPKFHPGCQTCNHVERERIESLYCAGLSLDKLAAEFPPLKRDAIFRHCSNHISDESKIAYMAGPAAIENLVLHATKENRATIDYLAIHRSRLFHLMNTAIAQGKTHVYRDLSPHLITALKTIGKITGEINEFAAASVSITNNNFSVMNSPVVAEFQSEIIDALRPYPEAWAAVLSVIERHHEPQMKLIESAEAPQ